MLGKYNLVFDFIKQSKWISGCGESDRSIQYSDSDNTGAVEILTPYV